MSEQQRDVQWAFPPEKPKNTAKVWLIVGLCVIALAIVGAILFALLPKGSPAAEPTPTASTSPSQAPTPTPATTPSATPTPTPTASAAPTEPPVTTPGLDAFAEAVAPRVNDAQTGLTFLESMSGQEAAQTVDQLRQDAEVLAGTQAPAEVAGEWASAVQNYAGTLNALYAAYEAGGNGATEREQAAADIAELRSIAGLN